MRLRVVTFLAVVGLIATACSSTPAATQAPASAAPATAAPASAAPASAAASSAPSAAASGGTSARDTLKMMWLGDITPIWHPAAYETFSQTVNFELMFDTLIRPCFPDITKTTYCPDLADSWSTTDAQNYTFKIHQGVKWQDGTPFSIDDIIWTINESQKWSPGRYKNSAWDAVKGGAAARDAFAKSGTQPNVAGAVKVDDSTLKITLENPDANWYEDLADNDATVLPQHILKDLLNGVAHDKVQSTIETSDFATLHPIGTGPYKYIKYETDQDTQFVSNPDYFLGAPKIKNVIVQRLKGDAAEAAGAAGDLDLAVRLNPADASIVQKASNLDTILSPGVGTYGPQFNLTDASGTYNPDTARCDTECRRAVSYGIDAPGIVKSIFGGLGVVNRGVNPGMPAADDQEFFDYSVDNCKAHLAKSTWDKTKPLRIIFDNSFAGVLQWTPVAQQNLQACGFNVDLKGMESSAAIAAYNDPKGYEILIMQGGDQGVGPFHQQSYYNCKQTTPAVWLYSYLRDCNVDKLFTQARLEADPAKQLTIFKQISSITNKAVDKTSLWTTQALSFKSKCLHGPVVPSNTRFFIANAKDWYFTC